MSRMLGYVSRTPLTPAEALGEELLGSFVALADLHRDGWGHAWTGDGPGASVTARTGLDPAREGLSDARLPRATVGLSYLRFASAGAAVVRENLQPFVADGMAFGHNGALAPPDLAVAELSDDERSALRGTTDSEVYFALLRRGLRDGSAPIEQRVAGGVPAVRALYPEACLNGMLIAHGALVVVHAGGTVRPPLHRFAERGFDRETLPRGHDDGYNVLWTTVRESGARVVATTGVDTTTWQRLEDDTVYVFSAEGGVRSAPVPS
ncbi:MAG: class II glutamine amidotransferase [Solirubrobacteraceae bacterium]